MRTATTLLMTCVGGLVSLGLVMLFSASMTREGGEYPVVALVYVGIGLCGAGMAAWMDYRHLKRFSWVFMGMAVVLLGAVLMKGVESGGARRWLNFGVVQFQPSELAKLAVVIALAHYVERYQRQIPTLRGGLLVPGVFVGVVLVLIFLQPDWGTMLLLAAVSGVVLLVGGVRWLHVVPLGFAAVVGFTMMLMNDPVRLRRVLGWLDTEGSKSGVGYQTWQSMLAFGSGGWTGVGLGGGMQKYGYVPEHDTDFIFPVVGEELGVVFTLGVVVAFMILVVCGIYIAWHARDTFGMLLGTGLTFLIGLQAFINIGVVTNVLPNKGLPLPFISRGGSNLVVMMVSVGFLIGIARRAVRSEARSPVWADIEETSATQKAR